MDDSPAIRAQLAVAIAIYVYEYASASLRIPCSKPPAAQLGRVSYPCCRCYCSRNMTSFASHLPTLLVPAFAYMVLQLTGLLQCAVYGTCMLPYASPLCYPGLSAQGHVRNVVRTMIYTTWALCLGTMCALSHTRPALCTYRICCQLPCMHTCNRPCCCRRLLCPLICVTRGCDWSGLSSHTPACLLHQLSAVVAACGLEALTSGCAGRFVLLATYNSYGTTRTSKARNWEDRMKCLSWMMGCSEAMGGGGGERAYDNEQESSRR